MKSEDSSSVVPMHGPVRVCTHMAFTRGRGSWFDRTSDVLMPSVGLFSTQRRASSLLKQEKATIVSKLSV
jgi:hypothetical protein